MAGIRLHILHLMRWSRRSPDHPYSTARWVRFLAERWLGREGPLWFDVTAAGPLQGPTLVGLQVVMVMAREGQVACKSLIRPLARTADWLPSSSVDVGSRR